MVNPDGIVAESSSRALAAWVLDILERYGDMPSILVPVLAELNEMWRNGEVDSGKLVEAKVAMWAFLDTKHGNSFTIADAEDRSVRAALTLAERPMRQGDIAESQDWVVDMIPEAASWPLAAQ